MESQRVEPPAAPAAAPPPRAEEPATPSTAQGSARVSPIRRAGVQPALQLAKLTALERALAQKEKALRMLKRREEALQHGPQTSMGRTLAAELEVLQQEVDALQRDCNIEAAILATSGQQAELMASSGFDDADLAAATALAAAADASVAAAEAEVAAEAARRAAMRVRALRMGEDPVGTSPSKTCASPPGHHFQTPTKLSPSSSHPGGVRAAPSSWPAEARPSQGQVRRLPDAWMEWRESQKLRQEHLKLSLRASWRAADSELYAMKQATSAKVDTRLSPSAKQKQQQALDERHIYLQWLTHEQRTRAQQLTRTKEQSSPSIAVHLNEEIQESREEGRALNRELREMRTKDWARRSAELRRLRQQSSPRVDDKFNLQMDDRLLTAASMYTMMAGTPTHTPPPHRKYQTLPHSASARLERSGTYSYM